MSARAGVRGEDGQIIPPLLVILLLCLAFGFMMLQVGLAADCCRSTPTWRRRSSTFT